ncbi:MAG: hypothetical protein IPO06_11780 [Leptospiraceae bacterium]|nr:hypothetical protein [Leptospiraceae bacterium]
MYPLSFQEFSDYSKCQRIINDLLISFHDDFAKYKRLVPVGRIRGVYLLSMPLLSMSMSQIII